jgi:hypothetical protein
MVIPANTRSRITLPKKSQQNISEGWRIADLMHNHILTDTNKQRSGKFPRM